jgi:hypothetical protein
VLLEPAVFGGQAYLDALSQGRQRYRREGADVVIDDFLQPRMRSGPALARRSAGFSPRCPTSRAW